MSSILDQGEAARSERAIRSLTDRAEAPLAEVRALFIDEFSWLGSSARVRKFLQVLTTSNVHAMLRQRRG